MLRPHPGWLITLFAAILSVSTWLPWLTSVGGHANAVGGVVGDLVLPARFGAGQAIMLLSSVLLVAGAMIGRGLSVKLASVAAVTISLIIAVLVLWYYRHHVGAGVSPGYGLFLGAASTVGAVACCGWALTSVLRTERAH